MKFFNYSEDRKKLNSFIKKIDIPRKFWVITFLGYLISSSFKSLGIILILPLVKGLIEKDYSFIFNNVFVSKITVFFPFLNELSNDKIFFLFALSITLLLGISMLLGYIISMYVWFEKQKFVGRTNTLMLDYYLLPESNFFFKHKKSVLQAKLFQTGDNINTYVTSSSNLINTSFDLLAIFVVLFLISIKFSIIALCFALIYFLLFYFSKSYMRRNSVKVNDANIAYNSAVQDILHRHSLIQIFNRQKKEKETFVNTYENVLTTKGTMEKINKILDPVSVMFEVFALFGMGFIIGNSLLSSASLGITGGIVFIVLFQKGLASTQKFSNIFFSRDLVINLLSKTLDKVLSEDLNFEKETKQFLGLKDSISVKNLKFKYGKNKLFNNFSAEIKAKKINCIIGPNGSGKSTLVYLIMRFKKTPKDSIFFDGVDVLDLDLSTFRKKISYVAQDIKFFYGTIRKNLVYGNECSDEILIHALDKVGLKDLVEALPQGLDTLMTDDGLNFSGGQRQRFAIVQALLNNPDIIIFDEATKSVDTETEDIIMNMLVEEFANTTRIIITHNKSHIELAENVITLK